MPDIGSECTYYWDLIPPGELRAAHRHTDVMNPVNWSGETRKPQEKRKCFTFLLTLTDSMFPYYGYVVFKAISASLVCHVDYSKNKLISFVNRWSI